MFYIDKDKELTAARVLKFIKKFIDSEKPLLQKYENYYDGNQAILERQVSDETKPNNKLVINYCFDIVNNYQGYLTGIPIHYSSNDDIEELMSVLKYNDYHNEDNDWLKAALKYGVGYELNYLDEEAQQRFKIISSMETIPIYSNDLDEELVAVIRFYSANDIDNESKTLIDVYTDTKIIKYESETSFTTANKVSEEEHYFGMVPITPFYLNSDHTSIFHQVITLQDAYNKLTSDNVNDYEAFVDAYLVLKGMVADENDLAEMKKNRAILADKDSDVFFLTKEQNIGVIDSLLKQLNDKIERIAKCPDFNDEKFMSQSGISIMYKLIGFENTSSNIEANMRKALQRRLELINAIQQIKVDELAWRDIDIIFTRNLPVNLAEIAQVVNSLRGLVSNKTLLAQIPFIKDVEAELAQLEEEAPEIIYDFNNEQDE